MLFYSYSYKCYVVETWFAGLTMIKPNIVNNWFNQCEHNGWLLKPGLGVYQVIWYQENCSRCETCTKKISSS